MKTGTYVTTAAWTWPATGTTWQIHHSGGVAQATAVAVAAAVAADEQHWSRFLADSDVSRLNAAAGSDVEVSQETLDLLAACNGWVRRTDGVFQPLIGRTLAAWGYDRSLADHRPHASSSPPRCAVNGTVKIDLGRGRAQVPAGMSLDLGGIAKGWMAGRAAYLLRTLSDDPSVLVDAGGDLVAARGDHLVDVEGPFGAGAPPIARLLLADGQGVATSGFDRRSWRNGDGRFAHHLIDPATGEPGVAAHATVVAEDPAGADVLAKTVALRPHLVAELPEAAMVIVGNDIRTSPRWEGTVVL
jgi:thiamine biosynthesis lipoprotein